MARSILKFGEDQYLIWSSIVDAPVSYIMTQSELTEYIREDCGSSGVRKLEARLRRCDRTGTSRHRGTLESQIGYNRAGEDESCLTREQIVEAYTQ